VTNSIHSAADKRRSGRRTVEGVAGLVLACGSSPAGELLAEVESAGVPAIGIGDCLAPRTVEEAVLDGLVAASGI
jgi:hypothetical protein